MTSRIQSLNLSPFGYRQNEHQRYYRQENDNMSLSGSDNDDGDDETVSNFSQRSVQPTQMAGMQKLFMKKFSTFRGRLKLQRLNKKNTVDSNNNNHDDDDDDGDDYSSFGSLQTMASSSGNNQKLKKISPFFQRFRNLPSDKKKTDTVVGDEAAEYLLGGVSETAVDETKSLDEISSPPDVIFFPSSSSESDEEEREFEPSATPNVDELRLLPPLSTTGQVEEVKVTPSSDSTVDTKKELPKKEEDNVDKKKELPKKEKDKEKDEDKKENTIAGSKGIESAKACCNLKPAETSTATTKSSDDDDHKFGKGDKLTKMDNAANSPDVVGEASFNFIECFNTEEIGSWCLEVYLYAFVAYLIFSLPVTLLFK